MMVINQGIMHDIGICASQLGFIHDELQFECAPECIEDLRTSLVYSATATEYYKCDESTQKQPPETTESETH